MPRIAGFLLLALMSVAATRGSRDGAAAALLPNLGSPQSAPSPRRAEMHEVNLRKTAVSKPSPQYPQSALAKKLKGVVVAEIQTDTQGRVVRVHILESPTPAFSDAVRTSLMKWAWPPPEAARTPGPIFLTGRLTFYFDIVNGKGVVMDPDEAKKALQIKASPAKTPQ